jgi:glycosyltransferase involved in cell wall biosynthesis
MSEPLVSICLPNLNTRPFLEERMETMLAQTFTDWELIVCDSHSDDGSWEFFQKFKGDPRIQLHQVPRAGVYAGWNECLRRARAEHIYLATSDDTASPQALEKLVAPLEELPAISIAVCDYQAIDENGRPQPNILEETKKCFLGDWLQTPSIHNGKTEFLLHACFGTLWGTMTAVLFRKKLLSQIGYFRTDRGSQADVEWSLRASLASDVAFVPGKLATWRIREGQATTAKGYNWAFVRVILDSLRAVLHDPTAGIPAEWKHVPGWEQEITTVWRAEYRDGFHLYRGAARHNPRRFLRNVGAALCHEPGWLLHQTARGFRWSEELNPDHALTARRLIELFHAPWPPQRLGHDAVLR